jgi:hypothetical protein
MSATVEVVTRRESAKRFGRDRLRTGSRLPCMTELVAHPQDANRRPDMASTVGVVNTIPRHWTQYPIYSTFFLWRRAPDYSALSAGSRAFRYGCDRYFNHFNKPKRQVVTKRKKGLPYPPVLERCMFGNHPNRLPLYGLWRARGCITRESV